MYKYKISIIIPIYNAEKYLTQCLNSVITQNLKNIEIICINDGSTDNTHQILESYEKKDKRIKIITQKNKGTGYSRNQGIKYANGEYLFFLDSDDWIEPNTLEKLYVTAKNNQSELVLFNAIEHLPHNKYKQRIYLPLENNYEHKSFNYSINKNLVMNGYLIVCTKLHKRTFILKHNLKFSEEDLFEDVLFHIESMLKAKKVSYNKNILYNYRRTEKNSRQNNSIKSDKSFIWFNIFNKVQNLLYEEELYDEFEFNFIKFKLTEIQNLFTNIDNKYMIQLYEKTKNNLIETNITSNIINKLNEKDKNFYFNIIHSNSYDDYKNNINNKYNKKHKDRMFFKKIIRILKR